MPISISEFVQDINPDQSILLFGAGSSMPSGAPSVSRMIEILMDAIGETNEGLNLLQTAQYVEHKIGRPALEELIEKMLVGLKPTKGLKLIPYFNWQSIYTTNYDTLVEQCYDLAKKDLAIIKSNFDFGQSSKITATSLYKLHGGIHPIKKRKDTAKLIITENDYIEATKYRELLFNRLTDELVDNDIIVIGNSLSDPHIEEIITKISKFREEYNISHCVRFLMYTENAQKSFLLEQKGYKVAFGSIEDLFHELYTAQPTNLIHTIETENVLDSFPSLLPLTEDVVHDRNATPYSEARIFNGWPATYSDIDHGLTFARSFVEPFCRRLVDNETCGLVLLGASGVGKTTGARQLILKLLQKNYSAWEHNSAFPLFADDWFAVAKRLASLKKFGVLFIDDAHNHVFEISRLLEQIQSAGISNLKIILASTQSAWLPRTKSPSLTLLLSQIEIGTLDNIEINSLIALCATNPAIKKLVGEEFNGFSMPEKRRRLKEQCEKDNYICLRNIFANESFDDIILREYASLSVSDQEIYKTVSALEASEMYIHRQLVVRILNLNMGKIENTLLGLTDIVIEKPNRGHGIYIWKGRHKVISDIIKKYKFSAESDFVKFLDHTIDSINPVYKIECGALLSMCSPNGGIGSVADKEIQNRLLRRVISTIPGEKYPRHRLIRNLIELDKFDIADTEIRIFKSDFGVDAPVERYKSMLLIRRATNTKGILKEDRVAILEQANSKILRDLDRFPSQKYIRFTYCDLGIAFEKIAHDISYFDDAIAHLEEFYDANPEPEIANRLSKYMNRRNNLG
jgi:GTPase SAR1 family protein